MKKRPVRSSEDRDETNTARAPPTPQLTRDKSCGGTVFTAGLSGVKTVGESEPKTWATSTLKCCRKGPEKAAAVPGSVYCRWEDR